MWDGWSEEKKADRKPYTEVGEFKGYPTITVFTGHVYNDKPEFVTLGLRKAKAVDDCIDAIRAFVDSAGTGKPGRSAAGKKS